MYDYESLEEKLRVVLSYFAPKLKGEFVDQVREFIEHREYGEAYELLCFLVASENQQIPSNIYETIVELGQQMKLPNEVWERLKPLSEQS